MKLLNAFLIDRSGAAAAELALITPLLLALLMGSAEVGNYFYSEHKLVKGVRDGARYAARQSFSNYDACSGDVPTPGESGTVHENTKLIVRKGTLDSSAPDLLPNWDDDDSEFEVTMTCIASLDDGAGGTYNLGGLYANSATGAPTVLVSASLPYRPIVGSMFGFSGLGFPINATQTAAVAGL